MRDYTLEEYLKRNKDATCVARIESPHKALKDSRPIEVYVDVVEKPDRSKKTYISLFNCGIFLGNSIILDYTLPDDVLSVVGERMIKELLSRSDFTDLDKELEGKCACKEFEDTYKSCEECPKYRYADGHINTDDDCLGAMYSIPSHMNFWNLEKEIEAEYGRGTENYFNYTQDVVRKHMRDLSWIARDEPQAIPFIKEGLKRLLNECEKIENQGGN